MAERRKRVARPLLWTLGGVVGALLVVLVLVVGPWLITRYPHRGLTAEQELKAKNDVRTTLVQALGGLAVAGGLVVTYSTYRQNQRDQAGRRAEQDRAHQLNLAAHVNELYTKAVEQLGHDQAPVRLGALYSLTHLAQVNPQQRQTVVDVLCAYLRMPYALQDGATPAMEQEHAQELQVRLTAQRLLGDHLQPALHISGKDAQGIEVSPDETFWPSISLDLTGATLVDLTLHLASVVTAVFDRATFIGKTQFYEATFTESTYFAKATFVGPAYFDKVTFAGPVWFDEATFTDEVSFGRVTFTSTVTFEKATFNGEAFFRHATFQNPTLFQNAVFAQAASFNRVAFNNSVFFQNTTFTKDAQFDEADFIGYTWFNKVTFTGPAYFTNATFKATAWFEEATFTDAALFEGTTFTTRVSFSEAHVLQLDDPDLNRNGNSALQVWPDGWTVHAEADDPTRCTLVHEEYPTSPPPAPPPSPSSR